MNENLEAAKVDTGFILAGVTVWLTDPEKLNMLILWGTLGLLVLRGSFMLWDRFKGKK